MKVTVVIPFRKQPKKSTSKNTLAIWKLESLSVDETLWKAILNMMEQEHLSSTSLCHTPSNSPRRRRGVTTAIPLLKGCMTQGDSRPEALAMIDEARDLWLEAA
ncbi:MAG: type II toxin-antitoxin system HicB family antitoxin [Chloroflexi bacterium]|nr:type II toxin-antitoxin system HicB family antitoxin [Chloroflexota bacterium]